MADWYVCHAGNLPCACRALVTVVERAVLMMVVQRAEHERNAEIQQANHNGC